MKRSALIILSAIYVLFSTGMHLEIDKCCDKLASIWIVEFGDDSCSKYSDLPSCCSHSTPCEEEEIPGHKGCDKVDIVLTIEDSHRVPVALSIDQYYSVAVSIKIEKIVPVFSKPSKIINVRKDHHPPDPLPTYILNSSLTYYG